MAPPLALSRRADLPGEAETVVGAVALVTGISLAEIRSARRTPPLCHARYVAMILLHQRGFSLARIGAALGRRDHATVLHGIRQADARVRADAETAAVLLRDYYHRMEMSL